MATTIRNSRVPHTETVSLGFRETTVQKSLLAGDKQRSPWAFNCGQPLQSSSTTCWMSDLPSYAGRYRPTCGCSGGHTGVFTSHETPPHSPPINTANLGFWIWRGARGRRCESTLVKKWFRKSRCSFRGRLPRAFDGRMGCANGSGFCDAGIYLNLYLNYICAKCHRS